MNLIKDFFNNPMKSYWNTKNESKTTLGLPHELGLISLFCPHGMPGRSSMNLYRISYGSGCINYSEKSNRYSRTKKFGSADALNKESMAENIDWTRQVSGAGVVYAVFPEVVLKNINDKLYINCTGFDLSKNQIINSMRPDILEYDVDIGIKSMKFFDARIFEINKHSTDVLDDFTHLMIEHLEFGMKKYTFIDLKTGKMKDFDELNMEVVSCL